MKTYLEKIAENIMIPNASTIIVQFWGTSADQMALEAFTAKLRALNHVVHGHLFDSAKMVDVCEKGPYTLDAALPLNDANVIIDLCMYPPTSLVASMSEKSRPNFITFMRSHFAAITGPDKMLLQIRMPSAFSAMEAGLSLETYTEVWQNMVMADYKEMTHVCNALIEKHASSKKVHIQTGAHRLTLSLEGRPWHKDAGEGDFPAGEVYVAPHETSATGEYLVDVINWEGETFESVLLTFENGRLIKSSESKIMEDLALADEQAFTIAEFGLGVNPNLKAPTGYALFDEKIMGSCHIAVGMNHLFGGKNQSAAHVDFVSKNPIVSFEY